MSYKVQLVAAQETPSQVLEDILASTPHIFPFPLKFIVEKRRYSVGEPSIENPYYFFDDSTGEFFIDAFTILQDYSQKHPLLLLSHQPYTINRTSEGSYKLGYTLSGDFVNGGSCCYLLQPPILIAAVRRTASTDNLIVTAHEILHSICDPLLEAPIVTKEDGTKFQTSHCNNYISNKRCIMYPPSRSPNDNIHEFMHLGFCKPCIEKLKSSYDSWLAEKKSN